MKKGNQMGQWKKTDEIRLNPVGVIRSEHHKQEYTPIQPVFGPMCEGRIEVFPEFAGGLEDIEGFSHIIILYWLHKAETTSLSVKPFLDVIKHGVFATRFPGRPNHIGLSIVQLLKREGNELHLKGVDVLDGTPLLDIKPYVTDFDCFPDARSGWYNRIDKNTAGKRGRRGYAGTGKAGIGS
jgi:tRNA-Thr(GGU) m(6)t(6)A37 methyltransferase TsaA